MRWLLLLLVVAPWVWACDLDSLETSTVIINDQSFLVRYGSGTCTDADLSRVSHYDFTQTDGSIVTLDFDVQAPQYVYKFERVADVPRGVYRRTVSGCLYNQQLNTSDLTDLDDTGFFTEANGLVVRMKRTVGRLRGAVDRSLTTTERCPFCFGVIGGIIGGALFSLTSGGGGGCSYCQAQFDEIKNTLGDLKTQVLAANAFNKATSDAITGFSQQFQDQGKLNSFMQTQISSLSGGISIVNNQVQAVVEQIGYMSSNLTSSFAAVHLVQQQSAAVDNSLYLSQQALMNATAAQFQRVTSALSTTMFQINDLYQRVYAVYTDREMHRNLRKAFHEQLGKDVTPLPSRLFSRKPGVAPITWSQRLARRTLASAFSVSNIHLQYASLASGTYTNNDLKVTFSCDQEWVANNTIDGQVPFSYLFNALSSQGTACYPTTSVSDQWTCACVLTITKTACQAKTSSNLFPWNWIKTPAMSLSTDTATHCVASPVTTSIDPSQAVDTLRSVFTSTTQWNNWYSSFCQNTPFVIGTGGKRLRMTSEEISMAMDFVYNKDDSTTPNLCDGSYSILSDTDNNVGRLSYAMYKIWQFSYKGVSAIKVPQVERELWGVIATDLQQDFNSFNERPDLVQTWRCQDITYSRVSDDTVPIYKATLTRAEHNIRVSINTGEYILINGNLTTIPMGAQNFTIKSDIVLTSDYQSLLPGYFYVAGDIFNPDSLDPEVIYDVPWSLFGEAGTPEGDKVNYISRNSTYAPSELFEAQQWRDDYHVRFEANKATVYPAMYMRRAQNLGGRFSCGGDIPEDGDITKTSASAKGDYNLCTLLRFFQMVTNYNTGTLYLRPNSFAYQFSQVQVPMGTYSQTFRTGCPTSYSVVNGTNEAEVTLETTIATDVTIKVILTQSGSGCQFPDISTRTYSASSPLVLTIPPCGSQYLQVTTLLTDLGCFSDPGLFLQVYQTSQTGIALPPSIVTALSVAQDYTALQIAEGLAANVLAQHQIALIGNPAVYADFGKAAAAVVKAIEDRDKALIESAASQGAYDKIYQNLLNKVGPLQQNFTQAMLIQLAAAKLALDLMSAMAGRDIAGLALNVSLRYNDSAEATAKLVASIEKTIDVMNWAKAKQQEESDCKGSGLTAIFTQMFCGFKNIFSSFGSFLSTVFSFIPILVIAGLVICLAMHCGPCAIKGVASAAEAGGHAASDAVKASKPKSKTVDGTTYHPVGGEGHIDSTDAPKSTTGSIF